MKLRNKKTGEVIELCSSQDFYEDKVHLFLDTKNGRQYYDSLAELNEEWEDAPEEPKEYWFMDYGGRIKAINDANDEEDAARKEIGNYFETKEEAELALRKLKAWKRLKDKGFRFSHIRSIDGVSIKYKDLDQYTIIAYADEDGCDQECLNLLFGGEE